MPPIHLLAVVLAAVASFIIGFLLHGPIGGKLWMKLADIHPTGNEKFSDMVPQMLWNLLANLVTAFALAAIYLFASTSPLLGGPGVGTGIVVAIWLWLGFLVASSSIGVIWMKAPIKLWLYENACSLVAMIVMGAIVAKF